MNLLFEITYKHEGKKRLYVSDNVDFFDLHCRLLNGEIKKLTIKSLWV